MSILVTCECGQQFQTRDENAGRRARCPDCGRELIVPKPSLFVPPEELAFDAPPGGRTSGKATASLVLGLCSFFCSVFTGIPAIILGVLGLSEINQSRGHVRGTGMAIAGIILGALTGLLLPIVLLYPAVQAAREAARRAQCTNNLKQIGLALHNYNASYGCFPPAVLTDPDGKPLLSWRVAILPFLEQQPLYNRFHLDEPWDSPHNRPLAAQMPRVYACPSHPFPTTPPVQTTYQVVVGANTMFPPNGTTRLQDVTDGLSNTVMVVEALNPVDWSAPDDLSYAPAALASQVGSHHPGVINALFGDGSVRLLHPWMAPQTLGFLLTRSGGEAVGATSY